VTDASIARTDVDLVVAIATPLEHNPAAVYLTRLAPSSRRVMRSARYNRRGEVTKQKAAQLLHVPYSDRRRGAV
jgi:hypothetical protein